MRVVRTTVAVAAGPPGDEAGTRLRLLDPRATPPPTAPPARTMAPMTKARRLAENTRLGENSAIGAGPAAASVGTGAACRALLAGRRVAACHYDHSRRFLAGRVVRFAGLLGTHLVGVLESRAVRVQVANELILASIGIGECRDPVGPHALGVLQLHGQGRRLRGRLAAPQRGGSRGQVVAARPC